MGDRPHSRVLGRRHAAALIGALAVGVSGLAVATPVTVSATSPASTLVIDGRGNGHGIGMSQWGAYGYAADYGWSAGQILDHYYGGTVAGTTDVTSMTVRLMRLDDQQTAVVNDRALLAVDGVAGGPWGSVVARETAARSYTVWARPDMVCPTAADPLATGWTVVASGVPSVTIRPVTDTSSSADHRDLAAVCESTGIVRSYRGSIRAVNGTAGENRTVNEVPLEHYLRPIVASEMSPSWAAKGSQALQAQAIAARTYSIAEKRYSYAKTCDLVCQFYPGVLTRQGVAGTIKRIEYPSTDAAVAATAGMVRRVGSATGPVAYAMFSSSSGGWTAASTLPFPAVEDLGDATAANPFHRWTVNVPASTVSNAWPAIGQYTGFVVNRLLGDPQKFGQNVPGLAHLLQGFREDRVVKRPRRKMIEVAVAVALHHRQSARQAGGDALGTDLQALAVDSLVAGQKLQQRAIFTADVEHSCTGPHQAEDLAKILADGAHARPLA